MNQKYGENQRYLVIQEYVNCALQNYKRLQCWKCIHPLDHHVFEMITSVVVVVLEELTGVPTH